MAVFHKISREIDSFFYRDPAARSRWEIVLCYPGFHAVMLHRFTHRLWRWNWKLLARFFSQIGRFFTGVEIHPGATIGRNLFIDHGMGVVIGETATIAENVTIYHGVTLGGTSSEPGIRHPQVGNHVIIGSGAQLLGPIWIGDHARIGSNAVVVRDVEPHTTVVGVPARAIKEKIVSLLREEEEEFTAYGTPESIQDPMQPAVDTLVRELEQLKRRIDELESQNANLAATAERWKTAGGGS